MQLRRTELDGVVVIEPKVFEDERGFFYESWSASRYAEVGLPDRFVQDNVSSSRRGSLRGLHLQSPPFAQGKLVWVLEGEVFDVAVDLRVGSKTFGRWVGEMLSAENRRQLYVPPGFAHGFCVTSERALFAYKCTEYYTPSAELSVLWNDPAIGIEWPIADPVLSKRDALGLKLADVPRERLARVE
jgi:dTDP-4-dehydrorhamnose 3,5-epimerase